MPRSTPVKPDGKRLRELMSEVEDLEAAGKWTEKEFRRILSAVEEAIGNAGEGSECVLNHAQPEWLYRLDQRPPD